MKRSIAVACVAMAMTLAGWVAAAAERGLIIEPATLRSGPGQSAASVARLEAGTEVERQRRSRGWLAIRTVDEPVRAGWVRVWRVRAVEKDEDGGNPILNGLKRFSRAVSGLFSTERPAVEQGNVTATIGVRGLKPGEFAEAQPDPAARERIGGTRANAEEAQAFARAAGLSRRDVGAVAAGAGEARDWGEW